MNAVKRMVISLAGLAATSGPLALAAGLANVAPPSDYKNARLGLWEMTNEMSTQGGPKIDMSQMQARMAESMKNMTPEQRARVEAVMKKQEARAAGAPTTGTKQKCITAAELDKGFASDLTERDNAAIQCTTKEVSRSSSKVVIDIACTGKDKGQVARAEGRGDGPTAMSQSGTMTFELKSPTEMESRFQMSAMIGNEPMKSDMKMHGRWISADCGKVK